MPEGPTIVLLKEAVAAFQGKKVLEVSGNAVKIDKDVLRGTVVKEFRSWGKQFFVCFPKRVLRIHFLLFGSYLVNEDREREPRLRLVFANGFLNLYACALSYLETDLDEQYDFATDVMSDAWDAGKARAKLKARPDLLVCDALLDQSIFSGVGNIIKNEVLFRIGVHPLSQVGKLPARKLGDLIDQARRYSFDFLEWKRAGTLKAHWQAHTRKSCPRDGNNLSKSITGTSKRRSFYCETCQRLYA